MTRCPKCEATDFDPFDGPTPGEMRGAKCIVCGTKWWQPKPENERAKRPARHRELVKKYGRGFCEMCGRPEKQLRTGETLEAQHVFEYQAGGEPARENIWIVCTTCHRLIHWTRRAYGGEVDLLNPEPEAMR